MTANPVSQRSLGRIRLSLQGPSRAPSNRVLRDCSGRDQPSAILLIPVGGSIRLSLQLGYFEISAGASVLLSSQRGLKLNTIEGKCYIARNISYPWPHQSAANHPAYILDSSLEQASILLAFVALCMSNNASVDEDQQVALGLGLNELIRYAFSTPSRLTLDDTGNLVASAELMTHIQTWIHTQLWNQDLCASSIMDYFFISRAALYQLFKPWGGVRAYIQSSRLIRARKELESAANELMTISALAIKLGFTSTSSFTRAFQRYWRQTPSSIRKSALGRDPSQSDET